MNGKTKPPRPFPIVSLDEAHTHTHIGLTTERFSLPAFDAEISAPVLHFTFSNGDGDVTVRMTIRNAEDFLADAGRFIRDKGIDFNTRFNLKP